MMATVPHVTSGLGLRKFQADGFLLTRVYILRLSMSKSGSAFRAVVCESLCAPMAAFSLSQSVAHYILALFK